MTYEKGKCYNINGEMLIFDGMDGKAMRFHACEKAVTEPDRYDYSYKLTWKPIEPKGKFDDVQVGDWVEFSNGEVREVENVGVIKGEFCVNGIEKRSYFSGWCFFLIANGKHATSSTNICAVRILSKSEAISKTTKSENLTFMEACDLLDSEVAVIMSRQEWGKQWDLRKKGIAYAFYCKDARFDEAKLNKYDRLATDWYVVKWGV